MNKTAFLLLLALPVPSYAQAPPSASMPATKSIDPARLAAARSIAGKLYPDGTSRLRMQATLGPIASGVADQIVRMPLEQLAGSANLSAEQREKISNASLRDVLAILDPAFEERTRLTMTTLTRAFGDILASHDPDIREGLAEAYAVHFSLPQLNDIQSFFSTGTGAAFASQSLLITSDPAVVNRMMAMMPDLMQAMPQARAQVQLVTAALPKPKTIDELSDVDRVRLAKLFGIEPAELKRAKTQ